MLTISSSIVIIAIVLIIHQATHKEDSKLKMSSNLRNQIPGIEELKVNSNRRNEMFRVMKSVSRDAPPTRIKQHLMMQLLGNNTLQRVRV